MKEKKAEMAGFPPGTPDLEASAGREGVGGVVRVRATVFVPPVAPGSVGMGNLKGKKLRGFEGFSARKTRLGRVGGPRRRRVGGARPCRG